MLRNTFFAVTAAAAVATSAFAMGEKDIVDTAAEAGSFTTLLTAAELERLEDHHGSMDAGSGMFKELVTWCQMDVRQAQRDGQLDSYQALHIQEHILNLRASMDGIYDYCGMLAYSRGG